MMKGIQLHISTRESACYCLQRKWYHLYVRAIVLSFCYMIPYEQALLNMLTSYLASVRSVLPR
ncbi:hypothetical protein B0O99DRAFT_622501 [Bisporella sp. PMI_857]|nr:hypothetical protein B0O99DRAFT_622501 [Bisporella sp. PMI_857]